MMRARKVIYAMMFSLWSVVWLTSGLVWANEALPIKPEPAPALPKPHQAESEANSLGKAHSPTNGDSTPKARTLVKLPATILGKDGNDVIYARDGERDTIDCGRQRDAAFVDRLDVVKHCETVARARRVEASR